jgi:hypothetical protein
MMRKQLEVSTFKTKDSHPYRKRKKLGNVMNACKLDKGR